jgi:GGDEF domain-containing protein
MVTGVVAACLVLAACGLAVYAVRRSRRESERRLAEVLDRIGTHLDAISTSVGESMKRVVEAQRERLQPLTLDFDELVDAIVVEAATRTGADSVVLRVEGPGGRPVLVSSGAVGDEELVERSLPPADARPFQAATIDWTYSPSGEADDERFHSALVAPVGPLSGVPGTLVAYSTSPNAFRPEHATALHELLAEVATGLANARRFADVEARLVLDPETGIANRRGYELELGREVARASRTGRPLSVAVVGLGPGREPPTTPSGDARSVDQFARLLTRVTRRSDISCRRGDRQFAILLPETRAGGAAVLTSRLREEVGRTLGAGSANLAVGHVEHQPDESAEALEARVEAVLGSSVVRPFVTPVPTPPPRVPEPEAAAFEAHSLVDTDVLRRDVLEGIAQEILEARPFGRSVAVVAVDVDGLEPLSERDREAADAALAAVVGRISESVGGRSIHRLGASEFVLVLPGATADHAEALLGSLDTATELPEHADIALSAGITELVERDGAQTVLARVEHALWQALQAGRGTVVVAVPGRRSPRFE